MPSSSLSVLFLCQAFWLSLLAPLVLSCGLPPAPAPPPMCCPCAPPAPPPPACCPCPPPPPPPPSCGGGCLAARRHRMYSSASLRKFWRNKREAANETTEIGEKSPMEPTMNNGSIPCPQADWAPFIRQAIIPDDAYASVHSIQSILLREVADQKFLVTCAKTKDVGEGEKVIPDGIKLSSSGHSFCNVREKERTLWCSAVSVSA